MTVLKRSLDPLVLRGKKSFLRLHREWTQTPHASLPFAPRVCLPREDCPGPALPYPALPYVGLHPGLSSSVAQSVPLGVQPAPLECLGWVKLSAWSLALSLHAAVPSPDERIRISLQAPELSLPKGARPAGGFCTWDSVGFPENQGLAGSGSGSPWEALGGIR